MKQIIISILFLSLALSIYSQNDSTQTYKKRFFDIGIIPSLSLNGEDGVISDNNVSLNLLWNKSHDSHGLTVSGLVTHTRNSACGIQIAGLINYIGEGSYILFSMPDDPLEGNNQKGQGGGLAIAGIRNAAYTYHGVQIAFLNTVYFLHGLQIGMGNIFLEGKGVQIGFVNSGVKMSGLQMGMINMGDTIRGLQLGLFNEATKKAGLQIGLANISSHNDWPIGLINIIDDGTQQVGLSVDEIGSLVTTFRSGGRYLYGIVGLGVNLRSKNFHAVVEAGIGAHVHLSKRFRIDNEVVADMFSIPEFKKGYESQKKSDHDSRTMSKYSYRILATFKCSNKIEIFAGPTVNYMQTNTLRNEHIFPSHSFWKDFGDKTLKQAFFGGIIGVSYVIK